MHQKIVFDFVSNQGICVIMSLCKLSESKPNAVCSMNSDNNSNEISHESETSVTCLPDCNVSDFVKNEEHSFIEDRISDSCENNPILNHLSHNPKIEKNDLNSDNVNKDSEDVNMEETDKKSQTEANNVKIRRSDSEECKSDEAENSESSEQSVNNEENEVKVLTSPTERFQALVKQCEDKLEVLRSENISLRNEIAEWKRKLNYQEVEFKKQEAKMKADLLANIEKLSRECNVLRKEKEAIVIRYANSEKEVIMDKKIQQDLEKKIKDLNKEREGLLLKLKNAGAENSRLSTLIENKMVEIAKLQKENEKLNADFNSREIRIKWLQNKLKTESNAHQETQTKLEHTSQRLNEMREEAEQIRKDCQEMIKCYQEAEEIKSVKLDSQLKQKLSELEVQKQEKSDQEQVYMLLRQELDALKKKQKLAIDDNNSLTLKINSLEKERLEYEQTLCKLRDNQNLLKEEIADLTSRLAEMEGLKLQLEQEKEKSAASLREVERLRQTNAELQSDLDACHVKEGDRLDFVEKLTAKTMLLQSDHCLLEVKAQALEEEVNQLKKQLADVQQKYMKLATEYEDSKKVHENEMQLLIQKLAEKAKNVEKLNTRLEEAENENRVLKKRHIASIKELSRELYQCRKRLESYESSPGIRAESSSLGSRTSSSASLHISNSNDVSISSASPSVTFSARKDTPSHQEKNCSSENEFKLDKEVLIERIINLQKMLAKKADKIDFLEDHIEHLVREMRKKSKSVDFKNV